MPSVLKLKIRSKRHGSLPLDPHDFESIGSVLRRMRWGAEAQMTPAFSRSLSLKMDALLDLEERAAEEPRS